MDTNNTALILIGYQNDYFGKDGILRSVVESSTRVLRNTTELLDKLVETDMLIITTPIIFSEDYEELDDPVGILKIIKEVGAFKKGTDGAKTLPEILKYGDRIKNITGKIGFNAFGGTSLEDILKIHNIKNVAFAGAVTSVCIDSTGRSAFERHYKVIQLSNCTSARSIVEQDFYCNIVFPIYSVVMSSIEFEKKLGLI